MSPKSNEVSNFSFAGSSLFNVRARFGGLGTQVARHSRARRLLEARIHSGVQHLHAAQRRSQVQGNTLRAGPTTLYRRPYAPLHHNQSA